MNAFLAQLEDALVSGTRCSEFESRGGHQYAKLTGIGIPPILKSWGFPVQVRGFAPNAPLANANWYSYES